MRLAYVDPQSYHGLGKYDAGYLTGLLDAGFGGEIRFYCSTLMDRALPPAITLRPIFAYNRKRNAIAKVASYLFSWLRLLMDAAVRPADVYHFQWLKFPPADVVLVLLLRRLTGARIVLTAHNVVPHGEENGRHRWLGRAYRAADAVVVHNESTAERIARRFSVDPSRFSVLRHGLITLEASGKPRHKERVERFAAEHAPCFVFIGRGTRYKGLDLLLEAWRRVPRVDGPGLIVIGAVDPELESLARCAAEREPSLLLIDEHVPEADLFEAARRADVVVLPHRDVSQSGVLLSVLGLGVPVLVSPLPGLLEPLETARVGWTFDGTADGLAERIGHLAAHPEAVAEIRCNRREWEAVRQAYDWKRIADRGAAVYATLLAR